MNGAFPRPSGPVRSALTRLVQAIRIARRSPTRRVAPTTDSYLDQFQARLGIRSLEPRCVLSGAPLTDWVFDAGAQANDGADDTYSISRDGADIVVNVNGTEHRDLAANIGTITITVSTSRKTDTPITKTIINKLYIIIYLYILIICP